MSRLNVDQIYTRTGTGSPTIREMPAFFAISDGNKNQTNNTWTVAGLDLIIFDTNSWYNTSTYRYTPQIAGYYQFNTTLYFRSASGQTQIACAIAKNGTSSIGLNGDLAYSAFTIAGSTSTGGLLYMNGSTDYVQSIGYVYGTSPYLSSPSAGASQTIGTTYESFLSGFLVRPD